MTPRPLGLITAALLLAGCTNPAPSSPQVSVVATPTASATIATPTPAPTPTLLAIGSTVRGSVAEWTVYEVKQIKAQQGIEATWAALIKTCIVSDPGGGPTTIIPWAWSMLGPDSETYEYTYVDLTPRLNSDSSKQFAVGQCSKGWVGFAVPDGAEVVALRYQNSVGETHDWAVR